MAEFTLETVTGAIAAGIVIVVIIWVPFQLYNLFRSDDTDATINNFNALTTRITNMESPSKQTFEIFMKENYFIASYTAQDDANTNINAPAGCATGCFCLCTLTSDKKACQPEKCATFQEMVEFTQPVFLTGQSDPRPICIHKDKVKGTSGETTKIFIDPYQCEK